MTRSFGRIPDGNEVDVYTLGSEQGLQAEILTLGGTLRNLTLPVKGKRIPLVLSLPDLPAYLKDTSYLGQLVGRYGNRIGGAAFELDGQKYKLTANNGPNTLHGGDVGFGKYPWKVLGNGSGRNSYVKLGHHSPAGINGFPGNLDVSALISVFDNTLTLAYEATTDAPTPISFTWHPYFNISGEPERPIDEQRLMLTASNYLPVNEARVPTGEIAPVAGTPFDFRRAKSVRVPPPTSHPQIALTGGFDHCWVLDKDARVAADLYSPASGVRMMVRTNLPGVQVYGAYHLATAYPGLHAICIEPENFPDAPNHANFPSSILKPGETHKSFMSFTFTA
ncbi:MAG TPA: aldose epimerase family protein [Steroidobacteraceae bacterium]|nr:aldose epimerase family protein [Steroidobacteraceae bacterium]